METLSIANCHLSQSDLDDLPQCLNLSELKHLYLNSVLLCEVWLKPLGILLETVTANLLSLELEKCGLDKFAFITFHAFPESMLPAHEGKFLLNFFLSTCHKETSTPYSHVEPSDPGEYPVPLECYDPSG